MKVIHQDPKEKHVNIAQVASGDLFRYHKGSEIFLMTTASGGGSMQVVSLHNYNRYPLSKFMEKDLVLMDGILTVTEKV